MTVSNLIASRESRPTISASIKAQPSRPGKLSPIEMIAQRVKQASDEFTLGKPDAQLQKMGTINSDGLHEIVARIKQMDIMPHQMPDVYNHLLNNLNLKDKELYKMPRYYSLDQSFKIEFAKQDLRKNPEQFCKNIERYGIYDQAELLEIAEELLKVSPQNLLLFIQNTNMNTRMVSFAKLVAKHTPQQLPKFFTEHIKDEFAIATRAIALEFAGKIAGWEFVCEHISEFGIPGKKALGIVIKEAETDPDAAYALVSSLMESEKDKTALGRIADKETWTKILTSLCTDSVGQQLFFEHFDKLPVDEQTRIATLKHIAKDNPTKLAENIDKLNITNQTILCEIFEIAIRQDIDSCKFANKFSITDEKASLALANLVMKELIRRAPIDEEDHTPRPDFQKFISEYLPGFKLNKGSRAVLCAYTANYCTSFLSNNRILIKRFFNDDEDYLNDYPEFTSMSSKAIDFDAVMGRLSAQEHGISADIIASLRTKHGEAIQDKRNADKNWIEFYASILDFAKDSPALRDYIILHLNAFENEDPFIKNRQMALLTLMTVQFRVNNVDKAVINTHWDHVKDVLEFRDPELRIAFIQPLMHVFTHPDLLQSLARASASALMTSILLSPISQEMETYDTTVPFEQRMKELMKKVKGGENGKLSANLATVLATSGLAMEQKKRILRNLIFVKNDANALCAAADKAAKYISYGRASDLAQIAKQEDLAEVTEPAGAKPLRMQNAPKLQEIALEIEPYIEAVSFETRMQELVKEVNDREKQKLLLRNLSVILETTELSPQQKRFVLHDLIFVKKEGAKKAQTNTMLSSAEKAAQFISFGFAVDLREITRPEDLDLVTEKLYTKLLGKTIEGFKDKYENTIKKWNNPHAVLTYAATLQKLPEDQRDICMRHYVRYVEGVLNGTYTNMRFDESSEFMECLKKNPVLLSALKTAFVLKTTNAESDLIQAWRQQNGIQPDKYTNLTITTEDDPQNRLFLGFDVGSCQSFDHDPFYSRGLVAYLLDPKVAPISIKNDKGVIVARTVLRLLWDDTAKKFVLFQETIYPVTALDPNLSDLLNRACKERARQLNLELYSYEVGARKQLKALKTTLPFEYVDSAGGIQEATQGYEINKCRCIFKP